MKISDLENNLPVMILTKKNYENRGLNGCYIGDLLSWVMSRAKSGNVWLTIMNNINIVAVASLTDVACIVLCEDVTVSEDVLDKANSEGVVIFKTSLTSYEFAKIMISHAFL